MLKDSKNSQVALIIGLIFLTTPVLLSLTLISRLDSAVTSRHHAFETKEIYDELSKSLKDLAILKHTNKSSYKAIHKQNLIETDIDIILAKLSKQFKNNPSELFVIEQIKDSWVNIHDKNGNIRLSSIEYIDSQLLDLSEKQARTILHSNITIFQYTRNLAIFTTLSFLIGLIMIAFALYSKNKQSLNRLALIDELNKLRTEAVSASNLKSIFLSTMSHEIRTPLNGIIGLSDVLLRKKPSPSDRVYAKAIHQSGKTLLGIINDILDFSKIESGKFELENSEFSIHEVLDQILFTLEAKAADKSLSINYKIEPDIPKKITGDSGHLSQVLFNLVGNAIKFTSEGSVLIRVQMAPGQTQMSDDRIILFSVEDTGEGLSAEEMKNLFLPFIQGKRAGTSGEPGTGLGLSISKHIVSAMGGTIQATSELGKGSTFSFSIRFTQCSPEIYGETQKFKSSYNSNFDEGVHPLFEKNAHRKVLIVEDNPTNQIVAQSMLSQLGATPTVAADGKEALELALKSKYDLILMDCQMPIMNGFEATAKLREGLVTTPIIAMTANVSKENERLCLTAGMNDFLPKPITINALRTVLTKYMQASPAASNDALDKLKQSIGDKATAKVVSIFISSLSDFKFTFESCIGNQNIEDLNRLGHKYKSSALTVGAYRFSELCKQLEQTKSIEEVMQMRDEITELVEDTSGMLASAPSEIIKFV